MSPLRPIYRVAPTLLLLALAALAPATQPTNPRPTAPQRTLGPISIETIDRPEVPLRFFIARIDLRDPRVRVRCLPAGDPPLQSAPWPTVLQPLGHIVQRENLTLAVNGDFFAAERTVDAEGKAATRQYVTGKRARPIGTAISNGKPWNLSTSPNAMLSIDTAGRPVITTGPNIPPNTQELISGKEMLVLNGKPLLTTPTSPTTRPAPRHPRTAVGLSADNNTLILIVVDGRSIRTRGATLAELAEIALQAGAHNALNLDGGGSTTLILRENTHQETLNTPSDGELRPIANALGIQLTEK